MKRLFALMTVPIFVLAATMWQVAEAQTPPPSPTPTRTSTPAPTVPPLPGDMSAVAAEQAGPDGKVEIVLRWTMPVPFAGEFLVERAPVVTTSYSFGEFARVAVIAGKVDYELRDSLADPQGICYRVRAVRAGQISPPSESACFPQGGFVGDGAPVPRAPATGGGNRADLLQDEPMNAAVPWVTVAGIMLLIAGGALAVRSRSS